MRSGEVARRGGVSVDTLAHFERLGLLAAPAREPNGYRRYPASAVDRVRLIQRALDMGFTLDDLKRVLTQRDAGRAPCGQVRAIAAARLQELATRIARLDALRDELGRLVGEWDARLTSLLAGARAGLLDALAQTPANATASRRVPRHVRNRSPQSVARSPEFRRSGSGVTTATPASSAAVYWPANEHVLLCRARSGADGQTRTANYHRRTA